MREQVLKIILDNPGISSLAIGQQFYNRTFLSISKLETIFHTLEALIQSDDIFRQEKEIGMLAKYYVNR